jgi:hypothetical protein
MRSVVPFSRWRRASAIVVARVGENAGRSLQVARIFSAAAASAVSSSTMRTPIV